MKIAGPSVAFSIAFAFALAACAKTSDQKIDSTAVTGSRVDSTTTSTTTTTSPSPETSQPTGGATASSSWVVTEHGIGKLRAGMTAAEARAAVPGFSVPASRDSTACTYGKASSIPAGVYAMIEDGKVVRVEVRRGDVATSTGARIGDTEARIKTLYPNVSVMPHKYTPGGHYLTFAPASSVDSEIVFETDGKRVVNYRAGLRPQVEYVEGCA